MNFTPQQILEIEELIESNAGHCDKCHQKIAMYRYKVNKQMVEVLQSMARVVKDTNENKVNFNKLNNLPYRLQSQRTKMRLHGLIAKVKHSDGSQEPNTWLITKKGAEFLRGEAIQETVVVFNNQVLGHEGRQITLRELTDKTMYGQEDVTTAEAKVYGHVRVPKKHEVLKAMFLGRTFNGKYVTKQLYEIELKKIAYGQPVIIELPHKMTYSDIAAFQRDWKVVR